MMVHGRDGQIGVTVIQNVHRNWAHVVDIENATHQHLEMVAVYALVQNKWTLNALELILIAK